MFHWNYGECKDWKKTLRRRLRKGDYGYVDGKTTYELKPQYSNIIQYASHIGIGRITKRNSTKFYNRITLYELVNGPLSWRVRKLKDGSYKETPVSVTLADVERMIGLRTNGSSYGAGEFHKRYIKKHV